MQTFAVAMNFSLAEPFGAGAPPLLGDLWQVTIAQLAPIMPYLLLVLVLIFRPTGLMGTREIMTREARARLRPGWRLRALIARGRAAHFLRPRPSLTMMSLMGVMIIFALSYNMLLGQTGLLSFGHAVYFGLGGFVAIHAMNAVIHDKLAVPVPLIPLVGGLAGLAFGVAVRAGLDAARPGIVFSMISLGHRRTRRRRARSSCAPSSAARRASRPTAPSWRLSSATSSARSSRSIISSRPGASSASLAMYALTRTPFGRMCNAVRDNPERVEFIGYSPRMRAPDRLLLCRRSSPASPAGSRRSISRS